MTTSYLNDTALKSKASFSPKTLLRKFHSKVLRVKFQAKTLMANPHAKYVVSVVFFIPLEVVAALMYCVLFGIQGDKVWAWRTKPMPMLFVIFTAVAFMLTYGLNRFRVLILLGLTLSLIGDIILISEEHLHFLMGLGVFFIAHVMYIIAFSIPPQDGYPRVQVHLVRAIPFALLFAVVPPTLALKMLEKENPDFIMIVAVFAYGLVLASMGWRVAARVGYPMEPLSSQIAALVGALFFILSDCLLAFNKFHTRISLAQVWVLSTYWVGQTVISFFSQKFPWDWSFELAEVQGEIGQTLLKKSHSASQLEIERESKKSR